MLNDGGLGAARQHCFEILTEVLILDNDIFEWGKDPVSFNPIDNADLRWEIVKCVRGGSDGRK